MNQSGPEQDDSAFEQLQKKAQVNRLAINRLKERVVNLERTLDLVCGDSCMQWLYRNRSERMDATVSMFPENRARFHLARYEFAADHVARKTVADIACGTGYGCAVLADQGDATAVTGVDICPQAIQYACDNHSRDGVEFRCADAAATGLTDQSIECVVSFETIEHVPDDGALIEEFYRILQPNGLLIISTPNAWPLSIAPHHVREYDRESFLHQLERRFTVESLFSQNSGSDFQYNHDQPAGIVPTTDDNHLTAECFIAVTRRQH